MERSTIFVCAPVSYNLKFDMKEINMQVFGFFIFIFKKKSFTKCGVNLSAYVPNTLHFFTLI